MESVNWLLVAGLTVLSFVIAHIWYGPIFGKMWQRIHKMDCSTPEKKKEMMKGIWKTMIAELVSTFLVMTGLSILIGEGNYPALQTAFMVWLFFVLPMCVSDVIWGADEGKYQVPKIAINAVYRLAIILIAASIIAQVG